jgi:DNA-binding transcriptional LysR family regulator
MTPFDGMAVFARVVEAGSFTRAAEELGLTKSAVSESVRRLETRLGVRLLDRTTRRIAPTEAGRAYHAHARRALDAALAGEAEARALQAEPIGTLRVAVPETFARLHLNPLLAELLDAYPGLTVELVEGVASVDLIADGFDLAIRVSETPADNLIVRRLGQSRVIVLAAPAYLARHGAPGHPDDLAAHRVIGFTPLFWAREWRLEGPEGLVVRPVSPALLSNSTDTLVASVVAGVGLAALPGWLVAEELAAGALVQVMPDWQGEARGIYAVYPSNRLMSAKVRLFVDRVAARLRRMGLT